MKYLCFYTDGKASYFYADNGKIYKRSQNTNAKLSGMYTGIILIGTVVLKILMDRIDELVQIDSTISLVMILAGVTVAMLVGLIIGNRTKIRDITALPEANLTRTQFETYVVNGKSFFFRQSGILFVLIVSVAGAFFVFFNSHKLSLYICAVLLSGVIPWLIVVVSPFRKYRFFKEFAKGNI